MKQRKADPRDRRVVNQLRRASGLSDWLISTGLFGLVAQWGLGYPQVFDDFNLQNLRPSVAGALNETLSFAQREWSGIILALALYLWFWSYRAHTNHEMDLLDSLYPEGQAPADWGKITNRRYVRFLALGIVIVFLLMAAVLGSVTLFALAMICLWCQDLFGNEIMRDNLGRVLATHQPQVSGDDALLRLYQARHLAARNYWLDRPHLRRIVFALAGTALALAVSFLPAMLAREFGIDRFRQDSADVVARLAMAGIILANEATMRRWRATREAEWLEAEIALDTARKAATAALPQDSAGVA